MSSSYYDDINFKIHGKGLRDNIPVILDYNQRKDIVKAFDFLINESACCANRIGYISESHAVQYCIMKGTTEWQRALYHMYLHDRYRWALSNSNLDRMFFSLWLAWKYPNFIMKPVYYLPKDYFKPCKLLIYDIEYPTIKGFDDAYYANFNMFSGLCYTRYANYGFRLLDPTITFIENKHGVKAYLEKKKGK